MLLAQNGFGKSDNITTGIKNRTINGVVLSPRDEGPERLTEHVNELRTEFGMKPFIVFDPQFYAATTGSARDGKLAFYDYYDRSLDRARLSRAKTLHGHVEKCLAFQETIAVSRMISPSILLHNLRDPWSQIAINLADAAMDVHAGLKEAPPLLLSIVLDEHALHDRAAVDELLDVITGWTDLAGFYLVVRFRDASYPAACEEACLSTLMYMVYVLSEVNNYEVIAGYADLVGLLLHSVGATATATGWFNSLRQFSLARFAPARGGGQPRPRYTSLPLRNSILVLPELETIYQVRELPAVLTGTSHDGVMKSGPANALWPAKMSTQHHWESLHREIQAIHALPTIAQRLDRASGAIATAQGLYAALALKGVVFEPASGHRNLDVSLRAISTLRSDLGI